MKKISSLTPRSFANIPEYVFLDTALSAEKNPQSFLFSQPETHIAAFHEDQVLECLAKVQRLSQAHWLAGYIRYEAASVLLPEQHPLRTKKHASAAQPLVWFGVYHQPKIIRSLVDKHVFPTKMHVSSNMLYRKYARAIAFIKQQLKSGNTYQVNFTFDFDVRAECSSEFLYFLLRKHQQTPYCAMIKNSYEDILSFSPELFFQRDGDAIFSKPMKGTAARGATSELDSDARAQLKADNKNQAENLMIVDLLRNDVGRICKSGTVSVPSMFDIETHPTLHQMTSIIQGELVEKTSYLDIFKALFPCGSVTGAPKIETMKIIHEIEKGMRGVYCGAIGYIAPQKKAVFSVPIRILQRVKGKRDWQYRVGSGIVWDSSAQGEWKESKLKTSFLQRETVPSFELLETMLWDGKGIRFESEHLQRLKQTAKAFQFHCKVSEILKALNEVKRGLPAQKRMVRLMVSRDGKTRLTIHSLRELCKDHVVGISDICLDSENIFLRHKTTYRPWYQDAMAKIRRGEVWDEIFLNQRREVCEGARSNIFVQNGGKFFTPPDSSGLLEGIFRNDLLRKAECEERVLHLKDVRSADAIYCGNSVRGLTQVRLL